MVRETSVARAPRSVCQRRAGRSRSARRRATDEKRRGKVILWDDTFVRYHEPHIGIAAVKVLEALGFEVALVKNRRCCGRPAFSQGNLDAAAKLAKHNIVNPCHTLSTLQRSNSVPRTLLLVDVRRGLPRAENRKRGERGEALFPVREICRRFTRARTRRTSIQHESTANIAIHPHCHAKSIMNPEFMRRLAERLPGRKATVLDTACCGMAGAFGALADKYDLSLQVAQRLLDQIDDQPQGTEVIASGTSCRHQITDLTNARPKHMAELLAEALM